MSFPKAFPKRLHGGVRIMNRPSPINVRRLDQNAMPMFLDMQKRGLLLNQDGCRDLDSRMEKEMEEIRRRAQDEFGGIDISSDDQVHDYLFETLKLPTGGIKRTGSGRRFMVDDDVMEMLLVHSDAPRIVQEFRRRKKIKTTYSGPLLRRARESHDGRVRQRLKLTRVVSGRVSSSDPNLMNIPVRTLLGKDVRRQFVPCVGRVYVSIDQSQIEMRMAAHEAAEDAMIRMFREKLDLHKMTASRMFEVAYDAVTPEQRAAAKSAGFGVLYGITAKGLQVYFLANGAKGWSEEKCQDLIDKWFKAYGSIGEWLQLQYRRAKRFGFVWDLWGRVRYVPEARSIDDRTRTQGDRNSGNFPLQSGAQGTLKLGMAKVWDVVLPMWWARGYDPWPVLQVHDELVFEVEGEIAKEFCKSVQDELEGVCDLRVPVLCGSSISGESWGALK